MPPNLLLPFAIGQKIAKWICLEDGPGPRGVKYKSGVPRQTWQVIAEIGQYNYVMEESDHAGVATRYQTECFLAFCETARRLLRAHVVVSVSSLNKLPGLPVGRAVPTNV